MNPDIALEIVDVTLAGDFTSVCASFHICKVEIIEGAVRAVEKIK